MRKQTGWLGKTQTTDPVEKSIKRERENMETKQDVGNQTNRRQSNRRGESRSKREERVSRTGRR